MKKVFAFVMSLCMAFMMVTVAFAAEQPSKKDDFELPSDAVVLYQSDDMVVYQSKSIETTEVAVNAARTTYQNHVTIPAGKATTGTFTVKNPHTIMLTTHGKVWIDSQYSKASANLVVHDGLNAIANVVIKASDGPATFQTKSHSSDIGVTYYVYDHSSKYDMSIYCELW